MKSQDGYSVCSLKSLYPTRLLILIILLIQLIPVFFPPTVFSQSTDNTRYVAFTFDDLPSTHAQRSQYIIENLVEKLRYNVPAIGFVNEIKLYSDDKLNQAQVSLLEHWLDGGFDLGNHSYSHMSMDNATLAEYKADVLRGEKVTKELLRKRGGKLRYYRHTQLRTGPTPEIRKDLDNFLKSHGYTVAPVTIDNNEYIFAAIYERARAKNDTSMMRTIGVEYVKYMESVVMHFEKLSFDFLGYEVKQILLLHANSLNADYLDKMIQMFQQRNYKFISLDEALQDSAYKLEEATSKKGLSWLHRWMLAKGLEMKEEPKESEMIAELFKSYK